MPAPFLNPNDPQVHLVQEYGPYGYQPKLAPAVVFTVVYALLALTHLGLTIKSRQWWLIVVALGAGLETAGNALRIYGHHNSHTTNPYIAMQVLVVVTPAFFAAMHFAILGKVLILFGRKFCFIPPKLIIPFFVTLDVASLAIQGAGSGIAAVNEIDSRDPTSGANIVVGGLAVQLLGYCIFDFLAIVFAIKAFPAGEPLAPPKLWTRKMKVGVIMAFISALLVLMRSCFRTGEMAEGWIGPVAQREWCYYAFDAAPVSAAVLILAIWHPSNYLPRVIEPPAEERTAGKGGEDIEATPTHTPPRQHSPHLEKGENSHGSFPTIYGGGDGADTLMSPTVAGSLHDGKEHHGGGGAGTVDSTMDSTLRNWAHLEAASQMDLHEGVQSEDTAHAA